MQRDRDFLGGKEWKSLKHPLIVCYSSRTYPPAPLPLQSSSFLCPSCFYPPCSIYSLSPPRADLSSVYGISWSPAIVSNPSPFFSASGAHLATAEPQALSTGPENLALVPHHVGHLNGTPAHPSCGQHTSSAGQRATRRRKGAVSSTISLQAFTVTWHWPWEILKYSHTTRNGTFCFLFFFFPNVNTEWKSL